MFLALASSFTGYFSPWHQLVDWAVTVITKIFEYIPFVGHSLSYAVRGSISIDDNTQIIIYTLHTGIIPILFIVLMSIHFWLIHKAGGFVFALESVSSNRYSFL